MKDVRISIRLSESDHTKLKIIAAQQKTTIQDLAIKCLQKELKKGVNIDETKSD